MCFSALIQAVRHVFAVDVQNLNRKLLEPPDLFLEPKDTSAFIPLYVWTHEEDGGADKAC